MKLLLLLVLVFFVMLFVAGVVAPHASRRLQDRFGRLMRRGEHKTEDSGGRVGEATNSALGAVRRGADTSAEAGRDIRGNLKS